MKDLPNDEQRAGLIRRMLAILERERPGSSSTIARTTC